MEDIAIDDADRHVWEELYTQHGRDILRYLVKLTGDRSVAEDLLQETFTQGMRAGIHGVESSRGWLFRIATNAARDQRRTELRHPVSDLSGDERDQTPAFDADVDLVHRALSALPFDD